MKNYEALMALEKPELAWFLMINSDNCRMCVYKKETDTEYPFSRYRCNRGEVKDTCIGGYKKWLDAEQSELDKRMFATAVHNEVVTIWNELPEVYKDGFKLKYVDGLAVGIEKEPDCEGDMPLPF